MEKTVWTVATSPGASQSSYRQFLEEFALIGDISTAYTIFPIHATHVPVSATRVMSFSPQNSHYTLLLFTHWQQWHARHLCCVVHTSLTRAAHEKQNCVCSKNFKLYLGEISTSQPTTAVVEGQHHCLSPRSPGFNPWSGQFSWLTFFPGFFLNCKTNVRKT